MIPYPETVRQFCGADEPPINLNRPLAEVLLDLQNRRTFRAIPEAVRRQLWPNHPSQGGAA